MLLFDYLECYGYKIIDVRYNDREPRIGDKGEQQDDMHRSCTLLAAH